MSSKRKAEAEQSKSPIKKKNIKKENDHIEKELKRMEIDLEDKQFHVVNVNREPEEETILTTVVKNGGVMKEVENPATEEENGGYLRVGYIEGKKNTIYHNLSLACLTPLTKPDNLSALNFRFKCPESNSPVTVSGAGKILKAVKEYMNKSRQEKSTGKIWKETYVEIPGETGKDGKKITEDVWKPLEALIEFRYRARTVPQGGSKKGRKSKKNQDIEIDRELIFDLLCDKESRDIIKKKIKEIENKGNASDSE